MGKGDNKNNYLLIVLSVSVIVIAYLSDWRNKMIRYMMDDLFDVIPTVLLGLLIILTFPVWVIPYACYKYIKEI